MRTRLLIYCLVFGIVSAADDQPERSVYIKPRIKPRNGLPPPRNGKSLFGSSVESKSVKVLSNSYKTGGTEPIAIPVEVDKNTPFQGNINQPIPVPVSYSASSDAPTEQLPPSNGIRSVSIQRTPTIPPIPILVKAPAFAPITSTPRNFEASVQSSVDNSLENPFSVKPSSFRLWPKLPDPVPVPVLTSNEFLRKFYQNIFSRQNPQKPPIPDQTAPLSSIQLHPDSRSAYPQNQVQSNPGPTYALAPVADNNAPNSYQPLQQAQTAYQSQSSQIRSQQPQNYIILASPRFNSKPEPNQPPSYQNNYYSANQNLGSTLQSQSASQSSFSNAIFEPSNTGSQLLNPAGQSPIVYSNAQNFGSTSQSQPGSQPSFSNAIFEPSNTRSQSLNPASLSPITYTNARLNSPGSQANSANRTPVIIALAPISNSASTAAQSPLLYAAFPSSNPGSQSSNPSGQSPLIYVVASPKSSDNSENFARQSPLTYAAFPSNCPENRPTSSVGQPPLIYAVVPSSNSANTVGQSNLPYAAFTGRQSSNFAQPLIYAVAPQNVPGNFANSGQSGQSAINYAVFPPTNNQLRAEASPDSASTPSPTQLVNYSPTPQTQPQSPQNDDFSLSSRLPAYYNGLSSSTESPSPQFYSSTSAPSADYSPSTVSRVSVSGAGSSYSYSL